jgi:methylisocitrate lyase
MGSPSPGKKLRDGWSRGPVLLPGVFCPLVAKMAERLGFSACYLSGGALSAGNGVPDIGLLTLTEFVTAATHITNATTLPLVCDADTGFGEALNVERTVRLFENAGAAGIHLEDQVMPKRCGHLSGKALVEPEVMAAKLRAAAAARRDPGFVIIARTDARGVNGFEDAVRRAKLYFDAGADAIFPEALESAEEFADFARALPAPLLANMTEFGRGPLLDAATLGAMGYKLILFPLTAFRSAMRSAEDTLRELLANGHQKGRLRTMQTRAELYELLGYTDYEARDRAYFGGTAAGDMGKNEGEHRSDK